MSHLDEINNELAKMHANHQLKKIASNIAERLDEQSNVMNEFSERLRDIEDPKTNEKAKDLS